MSVRYLRLVLLVCFPQVLHAQPCRAPRLDGGYFVPERGPYAPGTELTYACDNGSKPAVEGWWAMSTCKNGVWAPKPQCIDQDACLPPSIPFATYTENQDGWYKDGHKIRIMCDKGYESRDATAVCRKGTWSSVPLCQKSSDACGEPPQIPHAVIIQEYHEVFAADSRVQYECEDGYTMEGTDNRKIIFCIGGQWTAGPTCNKDRSAAQGHSAEVGTGGGHTTSAGRGTQPADRDTRPGSGHGGSTVGGTGGGHTTSAGRGTQPADRETRPGTGHGGGTSGSMTPPVGGGSSATSGSGGTDSRPMFTPVVYCGAHPNVPNAVVQENPMYLKYQCNDFYKLVGLDTVVCLSNGKWSELPVCKDAFCVVEPALYNRGGIRLSVTEYIKEGETKTMLCGRSDYYSIFQCTNGKITFTDCCWYNDHYRGVCPVRRSR